MLLEMGYSKSVSHFLIGCHNYPQLLILKVKKKMYLLKIKHNFLLSLEFKGLFDNKRKTNTSRHLKTYIIRR